GCPVVLQTVHGFFFHDLMPPVKRHFFVLVERMAALCSDAMLLQSLEDLNTAAVEGIGSRCPHKIHLENGIDLSIFDPERFTPEDRRRIRNSLGIREEEFVLMILGRLTRHKGYFELAEAMRSVVKENPRAKLLCVGPMDTDRAGAFDPAEEGLAHVPWAQFLGYRTDIPELLCGSDMAVLPTYYEGYPRFLMEASAMGLPSVATDVRGCREVVAPGQTGILVPPYSVRKLKEAIIGLMKDEPRRRAFGKAARRRAVELFDEQKVFAKVADMYHILLEKRARDGKKARMP
ncbi:MAG: glycosyltransferase, partial [Phycisphaerae bacterium]|nr:glycosyltransferase [Phycisphaerae bacterium]